MRLISSIFFKCILNFQISWSSRLLTKKMVRKHRYFTSIAAEKPTFNWVGETVKPPPNKESSTNQSIILFLQHFVLVVSTAMFSLVVVQPMVVSVGLLLVQLDWISNAQNVPCCCSEIIFCYEKNNCLTNFDILILRIHKQHSKTYLKHKIFDDTMKNVFFVVQGKSKASNSILS